MLNIDVLVIGAGPAGIAAAVRAKECGKTVAVIDDNPAPGGQIWRGKVSNQWLDRLREMQVLSGSQVVSTNTTARTVLLEQGDSRQQIGFRKLILATGAREFFVPFPGWTLPGVMGVGGLQALAQSGMPVAGKRIVVGGSGPLLLAVAAHLKKMGAHVLLVAEQASQASVLSFATGLWRYPGKIPEAIALRASLATVPYRFGCAVVSAAGKGRLEEVTCIQGGKRTTVACDYAAIAYGLYPNTDLASAFGCQATVDEWQQTSVDGILAAGECTGIGGVDKAILEGEIAGYVAADNKNAAFLLFARRRRTHAFAQALTKAFALRPEIQKLTQPDTIVCRCEDVSRTRLQSMPSFRAAKLHTRCGMGACQGRICGPAVRFLFGWQIDTVRPPTFPARIGSLIDGGAETKL